jgi:hypothetical protein
VQTDASSPVWLPPDERGVLGVPAGRWWDAVRVSSFDGVRAIGRLQARSGPVIEDQADGVLYWLVAPGSAERWNLPGVDVLGAGRTLRIPPAEWTQGRGPAVRWLIPPHGDCLTDPDRLRDALAAVTGASRFTEPVRALRRCGCGELVVRGERHACVTAGQPQEPAR